MIIHIRENDYLVLSPAGTGQEVREYVCRRINKPDSRCYKAAQIPASRVHGGIIPYLMEQVQQVNFHEFVDYSTDADYLTILMDCGQGDSLESKLKEDALPLAERLKLAEKLLEHLILSAFPPYFIYASMGIGRIKVNAAMEYSFDFQLSDFLYYEQIDFSRACRKLTEVLEQIFAKELRRRAFPEMEKFLFRLRGSEFEELLPIYQELEKICREWDGREEHSLESRSFSFRLWEGIKGLGRWSARFVKLVIILAAAAYLVLSVYDFMQPEEIGQVYEQIGDLEIRNSVLNAEQPEAEKK